QVGGRDRDIAEGWRRRSEGREAEGREGGRRDRELFKTNRQAGERDPDRGQDREDEDEARQSADGGLRKSDAEDHEHLGCKEDQGRVEGEQGDERQRRGDRPADCEDHGDRGNDGRGTQSQMQAAELEDQVREQVLPGPSLPDRKSTRLNSSHVKISYAVFCLKKKKKK